MSNKFFNRVHPLSILAALAMASTQGCAVAAEEVDCEVLQGTGINQFELQFAHGDEAAHAGLELCVIAENYDACDKLEGTADENVFVVNYDAAVSNVRSLRIRGRVEAASAALSVRVEAAHSPPSARKASSTRSLKSAPGKGKHVAESSVRPDAVDTHSFQDAQERVGVVLFDGADEALQWEVVAVSRGDRALVVSVAAGSYPVEIAAEAKPGRFGTEGGTEIASCQ
ncbi:MAG: hypothetical protein VB934_02490 [Polyangiaceae bacterium]